MQMRFRVRTRDGRELTAGSLEAFAQLVGDGDVTAFDLIHDALTQEWVPAKMHPVFRLVSTNLVAGEGTESRPAHGDPMASSSSPKTDGPEAGAPSARVAPSVESVTPAPKARPAALEPVVASERSEATLAQDLGLSLAPAAPEPTAEQAKAAFIAEIETERATDPDIPVALGDISVVAGGSRLISGVVEPPPEPEPEPAPAIQVARPKPAPSRPVPQPAKPGGRIMWIAAAATVVLAMVASSPPLFFGRGGETEVAADRPQALRVPDAAERTTRERAESGYGRSAVALMRTLEVGDIPPVWLDGTYFANAADHPEVREAWDRYLTLIWSLRTEENAMYREAYLAELDREGVTGALRSMRVAGSMPDFQAGRPRRMATLRPVEELAMAAVALHELLVRLDGSILYEPARGPVLSRDPVLEAAGANEDAQEQLELALDRVTEALNQDGTGPVERDRVRPWVREQVAALGGDSLSG